MPESMILEMEEVRQVITVADLPDMLLIEGDVDNFNLLRVGEYMRRYPDQAFELTIEQFLTLEKSKRKFAQKAKKKSAGE